MPIVQVGNESNERAYTFGEGHIFFGGDRAKQSNNEGVEHIQKFGDLGGLVSLDLLGEGVFCCLDRAHHLRGALSGLLGHPTVVI